MKTAKLVIGIISIVLAFVTGFQACAAGVGDALEGSGTGGAAGIIMTLCLIIAGIVGICTRESRGGGIAAGVIYLIGALVGFTMHGIFTDLMIWSALALVFGIIFIAGSWKMPKKEQKA
jgi:hypothetical protein